MRIWRQGPVVYGKFQWRTVQTQYRKVTTMRLNVFKIRRCVKRTSRSVRGVITWQPRITCAVRDRPRLPRLPCTFRAGLAFIFWVSASPTNTPIELLQTRSEVTRSNFGRDTDYLKSGFTRILSETPYRCQDNGTHYVTTASSTPLTIHSSTAIPPYFAISRRKCRR
jgi:hypothetical protein